MPRQDCFEIDYSLGRPALFSNGAHCVGTKNDSGAEQIVAKSNFLLQLSCEGPSFPFPFFFLLFRCLSRHLRQGSRAETGVHRGSVPPPVIVCDAHNTSSHRAPALEGLHSRDRRSLAMLRLPPGLIFLSVLCHFSLTHSAPVGMSENACFCTFEQIRIRMRVDHPLVLSVNVFPGE